MRRHFNQECEHTDPIVNRIKQLHDDEKPGELLEEIAKLRTSADALTEFQAVVLKLHEIGAWFSLPLIDSSEFIKRTNALEAELLEVGGYEALADMRLWRVQRVIRLSGVEAARSIVRDFFRFISEESLTFYGDIACAYLYEADGEPSTAIGLCEEVLASIDKELFPCSYECIALYLAQLLVAGNAESAARRVLAEAGIPEVHIDEYLRGLA